MGDRGQTADEKEGIGIIRHFVFRLTPGENSLMMAIEKVTEQTELQVGKGGVLKSGS